MLTDRFGRQINYLRLSVTDRCDFRCQYCMNEQMEFLPRASILSLEELERLARVFVKAGVRKIRITGGEPLVRKDVMRLIEGLGALKAEGLEELVMTTNGASLEKYAEQLAQAGVSRLNISLDSLDEQRFREMTRVGDLDRVLRGIDKALEASFERIKLNVVLMKGINDCEAGSLVDFALDKAIDISFIEEMPLGEIVSHSRQQTCFSNEELFDELKRRYALSEIREGAETNGPARRFRIEGTDTRIGFISPHSQNFCASCNRVRLTAEGKLLLCLGNEHAVDFRELLRGKACNDDELLQAFVSSLDIKPEKHEFDLEQEPQVVRFMNMTGG